MVKALVKASGVPLFKPSNYYVLISQFMVTGQDGKAGANAVRAVVVEIRAECEPAQIHHLFMVAGSVQEGTRRLAFATDGRVQVRANR